MVVTVTPTRRRSNGNEDTVCRYVEHAQDCMHIKQQVVQLLNVDDPMRFILQSTAVIWRPYPRMVLHKQRAHFIQDSNGIQMGLAQLSFHRTCQLEEDLISLLSQNSIPSYIFYYLFNLKYYFQKILLRSFLFEIVKSSCNPALEQGLCSRCPPMGLGGASKVAGSCCVHDFCVCCVYRFLKVVSSQYLRCIF